MIQTQRYIRKPLYVDAVRITAANFDEIAEWCQGEIQQEEVPGKGTTKKFIRVRVQNPKNPRQTKAFVGDWILYTETSGYKVYTVKAFHTAFDKVTVEKAVAAEVEVSTDDAAVRNHIAAEELEAKVAPELLKDQEPPVDVEVNHQITEAHLKSIGPVAADPSPESGVGPIHTDGLPKYPEPELVPATPENIAQAVQDTEAARQAQEAEPVQPSAVEGKRVLSIEEQKQMTPEELKELIQEGDVVLAQDIALP